jgi:hypothetical protein
VAKALFLTAIKRICSGAGEGAAIGSGFVRRRCTFAMLQGTKVVTSDACFEWKRT